PARSTGRPNGSGLRVVAGASAQCAKASAGGSGSGSGFGSPARQRPSTQRLPEPSAVQPASSVHSASHVRSASVQESGLSRHVLPGTVQALSLSHAIVHTPQRHARPSPQLSVHELRKWVSPLPPAGSVLPHEATSEKRSAPTSQPPRSLRVACRVGRGVIVSLLVVPIPNRIIAVLHHRLSVVGRHAKLGSVVRVRDVVLVGAFPQSGHPFAKASQLAEDLALEGVPAPELEVVRAPADFVGQRGSLIERELAGDRLSDRR